MKLTLKKLLANVKTWALGLCAGKLWDKILHSRNALAVNNRAIFFAFLFFTLPAWSQDSTTEVRLQDFEWQTFADDLEVAQVNLRSSTIFSAQITFARTSLRLFRVGVIRAAEFGRKSGNVSQLCKLGDASLCINANFFDQDGDPLGLVISKGFVQNKLHRGGNALTGVFLAGRNLLQIVSRAEFKAGSAFEAVQAGPRLVAKSSPVEKLHNDGRTRRSGLCIDKAKRLLFFAVSSDLVGVAIPELQQVLVAPRVGCVDALNLDGGGSSQLFISAQLPGSVPEASDIFLRGRDEVPIALALFPLAR